MDSTNSSSRRICQILETGIPFHCSFRRTCDRFSLDWNSFLGRRWWKMMTKHFSEKMLANSWILYVKKQYIIISRLSGKIRMVFFSFMKLKNLIQTVSSTWILLKGVFWNELSYSLLANAPPYLPVHIFFFSGWWFIWESVGCKFHL